MRAGLRVFLVCQGVGNGWEFMRERMRSRKEGIRCVAAALFRCLWFLGEALTQTKSGYANGF
jgi:hypothetical protein